jgi:hypothetical protein
VSQHDVLFKESSPQLAPTCSGSRNGPCRAHLFVDDTWRGVWLTLRPGLRVKC